MGDTLQGLNSPSAWTLSTPPLSARTPDRAHPLPFRGETLAPPELLASVLALEQRQGHPSNLFSCCGPPGRRNRNQAPKSGPTKVTSGRSTDLPHPRGEHFCASKSSAGQRRPGNG